MKYIQSFNWKNQHLDVLFDYPDFFISQADNSNYYLSIFIYEVLFLPKLQSHFAEFLQYSSLIHLSLLDLSTCVGLGYGLLFKKLFPEKIKVFLFFVTFLKNLI